LSVQALDVTLDALAQLARRHRTLPHLSHCRPSPSHPTATEPEEGRNVYRGARIFDPMAVRTCRRRLDGMSVFTEEEIEYLRSQALARIATVGPDGHPHVIPVTFRFNEEL